MARNVSFKLFVRWPIYVINSVDETKYSDLGTIRGVGRGTNVSTFPNFSTPSDKGTKLKRIYIFNSCLNLLFFVTFSLSTVLVSRLSSGWKYTASF